MNNNRKNKGPYMNPNRIHIPKTKDTGSQSDNSSGMFIEDLILPELEDLSKASESRTINQNHEIPTIFISEQKLDENINMCTTTTEQSHNKISDNKSNIFFTEDNNNNEENIDININITDGKQDENPINIEDNGNPTENVCQFSIHTTDSQQTNDSWIEDDKRREKASEQLNKHLTHEQQYHINQFVQKLMEKEKIRQEKKKQQKKMETEDESSGDVEFISETRAETCENLENRKENLINMRLTSSDNESKSSNNSRKKRIKLKKEKKNKRSKRNSLNSHEKLKKHRLVRDNSINQYYDVALIFYKGPKMETYEGKVHATNAKLLKRLEFHIIEDVVIKPAVTIHEENHEGTRNLRKDSNGNIQHIYEIKHKNNKKSTTFPLIALNNEPNKQANKWFTPEKWFRSIKQEFKKFSDYLNLMISMVKVPNELPHGRVVQTDNGTVELITTHNPTNTAQSIGYNMIGEIVTGMEIGNHKTDFKPTKNQNFINNINEKSIENNAKTNENCNFIDIPWTVCMECKNKLDEIDGIRYTKTIDVTKTTEEQKILKYTRKFKQVILSMIDDDIDLEIVSNFIEKYRKIIGEMMDKNGSIAKEMTCKKKIIGEIKKKLKTDNEICQNLIEKSKEIDNISNQPEKSRSEEQISIEQNLEVYRTTTNRVNNKDEDIQMEDSISNYINKSKVEDIKLIDLKKLREINLQRSERDQDRLNNKDKNSTNYLINNKLRSETEEKIQEIETNIEMIDEKSEFEKENILNENKLSDKLKIPKLNLDNISTQETYSIEEVMMSARENIIKDVHPNDFDKLIETIRNEKNQMEEIKSENKLSEIINEISDETTEEENISDELSESTKEHYIYDNGPTYKLSEMYIENIIQKSEYIRSIKNLDIRTTKKIRDTHVPYHDIDVYAKRRKVSDFMCNKVIRLQDLDTKAESEMDTEEYLEICEQFDMETVKKEIENTNSLENIDYLTDEEGRKTTRRPAEAAYEILTDYKKLKEKKALKMKKKEEMTQEFSWEL